MIINYLVGITVVSNDRTISGLHEQWSGSWAQQSTGK